MIINDVLLQLESAAGPVVKVLHRTGHTKVIVLGFKKGMILKEHQTGVTTKLVICEGNVIFQKADGSVTLNKFDDLDVPVNVPHSVEALEDSICFLIQGE